MYLEFYEQEGVFNLMDSDDFETQWYVTLRHEDSKIVERDGVRCRLHWSEQGDERGKYDISDGLDYLAELSFKYGCGIWGTTDYKGETLAFVKTFNENKDEIVKNYEAKRKERIEEEIKQLQNKLQRAELDAEDIDIVSVTEKEVEKLNAWIASSTEKMSMMKEHTPMFEAEAKRIEDYEQQLKKYI
jgi:hypothetical protein